ncbi:NADP-dependent oxidoreductase [Tomitella biformata]|uniref:NADP-dependent oxidoreductase n=1 Tax=Tomitella biformata TaxID=630403 RepID=UPI0004673F47|nr:NADP-dependent oxidoreductase [Tomitella biformata]
MTPFATARSVHLVARPHGAPTPGDFAIVEEELRVPGPGEITVRNVAMSVDPYMRGRMDDRKSYVPPFELNKPMDGGAVGEVIAVGPDVELPVGAMVLHGLGWRDHAVLPARSAQIIDTDLAPATAYLGVLGMTGLTAFGGLTESASFKEGDAVFVSGAAGAVGSLVGQLAKARGAARVIGSAGSAEKVRYLVDELGFDAAFNYKDGPIAEQLAQAAPDGIDVYFDNVGGEHLEAAIGTLNVGGRIAVCGAISQYNSTVPAVGPRNMWLVVASQLRIQGFLVRNFPHLKGQFAQEVGGYLKSGQVQYRETFVDGGVDSAVDALLQMMDGKNIGKMVVRF